MEQLAGIFFRERSRMTLKKLAMPRPLRARYATLRLNVALIKRQTKKRGSFFEPKENTIDGRKIPMSILSTVQWPFKWRRTMTHLGFCRCRKTCHQNRLRAEMVV